MKPVRPLNYRHAYHAGNFADVFKHAALIQLLESFRHKPTPFCYMDTHAGRGMYDLGGIQARKTAESDAGVTRLLDAGDTPDILRPYLQVVSEAGLGADEGARCYPGSPWIAAQYLREGDRAVLCELQPDEASALRRLFSDRPAVHVHQRDGYEALGALLPPREKRGLVLVDPPFEAREEEFRIIRAALEHAIGRWPNGRYAVWYPIKLRQHVRPFQRWLTQRFGDKLVIADWLLRPADSAARLNGCGLAVINPPWGFAAWIDTLLDTLRNRLVVDGPGEKHVQA